MFATKTDTEKNGTTPTQEALKKEPGKTFESEETLHEWQVHNERKSGDNNTKEDPEEEEYLTKVKKIKKLLKGSLFGIADLRNSVKADEAIEAYEIAETFSEGQLEKFQHDYPGLMTVMIDNLPASYRRRAGFGFAKGIKESAEEGQKKSDIERLKELQVAEPRTEKEKERNRLIDNMLAEQKDVSQDPTPVKKDQETSLLKMGIAYMSRKGAFEKDDLQKSKGAVRHMMGKATAKIEGLRLDKFQDSMGGHVSGMEFTDKDPKQQDGSLAGWLQDKGVAKDVVFEEPESLKSGAISYYGNLKEGHAQMLAATLPYEQLNYIDSEMSIKGEAGAFRKIFLDARWSASKNEVIPINIRLHLGEIEMNQLRIIMKDEAYGMGKLAVSDATLDMTVAVPGSATETGMDFMFALMDIFANVSTIANTITMVAVSRMQGEGEGDAKTELIDALNQGLNDTLTLSLNFGQLNISNFISTSLGFIENINLGPTTIDIDSDAEEEKGASHKKELAKLEGEISDLKDKRGKRNNEARIDRRIEKLKKQGDRGLSKTWTDIKSLVDKDVKRPQSYDDLMPKGDSENKAKYAVNIKTEDASLKQATMVDTMINGILKAQLSEIDLDTKKVFEDVTFKGLDFTTTVSSGGVDQTTIDAVEAVVYLNPGFAVTYADMFSTAVDSDGKAFKLTIQNIHAVLAESGRKDLLETVSGTILFPADKEAKTTLAGSKGSFGVKSVGFKYSTGENEKLDLQANLSELKLPSIKFGKDNDPIRIRGLANKVGSEQGASMKDIHADLTYSMSDSKITLNKFHAGSITASDLKINYNGSLILLRGDTVINGFSVSDVSFTQASEKSADSDSGESTLDTSNLKLGFNNLSIPEVWYGMSRAKGVSIGQTKIEAISQDDVKFDLKDVQVDSILHQETQGKEGADSKKLKGMAKAGMEGKANISGQTGDITMLTFNLPQGNISLPRIYYKDQQGNHIYNRDNTKAILVENPMVSLRYDSKKNRLNVEHLYIKKIAAEGLDAQFGNKKINIPEGHSGSINDMNLTGLNVDLDNNAIIEAFKASTGETNLTKAHLEIGDKVSNFFKATPTLSWESMSFEGVLGGEFDLTVTKPQVGLTDGEKRFDHALEVSSNSQGFQMNTEGIFQDTPIFSADKIRVVQTNDGQGEKSQTIIATNPNISDITLEGKYFGGESPIDFDKIIIGGKTEGDMVIENCASELTVKGQNDILVKEAVLILPPAKEPKPDNKPLEEKYPDNTGEFDFLNGANGKVVVKLFDDGHFELPIVDGYIELDPFLKEVGDYLASKTSGRPNWILDDLHTSIANREDEKLEKKEKLYKNYEISTTEYIESPILKLINNPDKNNNIKLEPYIETIYTPVGMGEMIHEEVSRNKYFARLAAIIETLKVENERLAEFERRGNKLDNFDWFGYTAATMGQFNNWINDVNHPMNPRVHIHLNNIGNSNSLDLFKSNISDINVDIAFDQNLNSSGKRKMTPIITIESLNLPPFRAKKGSIEISSNGLNANSINLKKEPIYEKKQMVSIKALTIHNLLLLLTKK